MPIDCSLPERFAILLSFSLTNCSNFFTFNSKISTVSFSCPIVWSFSTITSGSTPYYDWFPECIWFSRYYKLYADGYWCCETFGCAGNLAGKFSRQFFRFNINFSTESGVWLTNASISTLFIWKPNFLNTLRFRVFQLYYFCATECAIL